MKFSLLFLTALITMAYTMPVDDSAQTPAKAAIRALDALMKRDCGDPGCPCNRPYESFCTDSCECQTACCSFSTALCLNGDEVIDAGDYCVGGSSGKI